MAYHFGWEIVYCNVLHVLSGTLCCEWHFFCYEHTLPSVLQTSAGYFRCFGLMKGFFAFYNL